MKYLTVLRHAKSSWGHPGLNDHDRPLNERGKLAAPAVCAFLAKTYFGGNGKAALMPRPESIVSSSAIRTLSTSQFASAAFGLAPADLSLDSRLYLASSDTILSVVRDVDEARKHIVVVGHNPGLHEFCDRMLARAGVPRMPTCTAVIMGLPHEYWGLADWQEAQLIAYITPKALARRFPLEFSSISKPMDDD
jgi:phosphohistidine phosphatase